MVNEEQKKDKKKEANEEEEKNDGDSKYCAKFLIVFNRILLSVRVQGLAFE